MSEPNPKQPMRIGEQTGYVPTPLHQEGLPKRGVRREQDDQPDPRDALEVIRAQQARQVRG